MAKVNERLRSLRKEKHWTQEELAKRLGLSPSAVGMYERGEREPNLETLEKMADVFGVSLASLFEGVEKKPEPSALEAELLSLFRRVPEERRHAVLALIKTALQGL